MCGTCIAGDDYQVDEICLAHFEVHPMLALLARRVIVLEEHLFPSFFCHFISNLKNYNRKIETLNSKNDEQNKSYNQVKLCRKHRSDSHLKTIFFPLFCFRAKLNKMSEKLNRTIIMIMLKMQKYAGERHMLFRASSLFFS